MVVDHVDIDGNVLPVYPRLLGHEPAGGDRRWRDLFGPRAQVVRIDRSVSINDEFEVFIRFFAPRAIATGWARFAVARSGER